jgi:putative phosphoribosyl transferase
MRRSPMAFKNRYEAGRYLAKRLAPYSMRKDVLVLGLPRGGVPVAYEVAKELRAPLDVFLVRKLGVPGHSELAMGAIASGGVRVLNEETIDILGIAPEAIAEIANRERRELKRREEAYRDGRSELPISGRTVILVDDGLATGSTMLAAVRAVRGKQPRRLVVAVPVGAADTCESLRHEVDEVVCAVEADRFGAVGFWYEDFSETSDDEVRKLLAMSARGIPHKHGAAEEVDHVIF